MTTRTSAAIVAAGLLALAACGGGDDDASGTDSTAAATATSSTAVEDADDTSTTTEPAAPAPTSAPATTPPPPTTEPAETEETEEAPSPDSDEPPVNTSPDGIRLLDFEFQPVPAGKYRVETIGAPFTIEIPDGWWVQPNSYGHFVLTDASSQGPGDRDIVMIRPSNLADPDRPGAPVEEQVGEWALDDIEGWLDALIPGVTDGEPTETTLGGLDALQFDVAITDEVECGEFFCVGFATNRLVNDMYFDRRTGYRVWWIDGGGESPIAVNIGDGTDPTFTERAQAVLDTVTFESVGPNPIPSEGDLWTLGIPSTVPAGTVTLPVGPGVTVELSEERFFEQRGDFLGRFLLDGPGEVDIFFPVTSFDDEPLATTDDVAGAMERLPGFTATVAGTREVNGYEATELEFSGPQNTDGPPPGALQDASGAAWLPPPDGALWIMETPDGLAVISAEWFESFFEDTTRTFAGEILDSIVIGG